MASAVIYEEEPPANLQTKDSENTTEAEDLETGEPKLKEKPIVTMKFDRWETFCSMMNITMPAFISMCLSEGQFQINMMHIGHKGTNAQVIGIGLANMLIVTWMHTLAVGIAAVLETLVS